MQLTRPAFAPHPFRFGRARMRERTAFAAPRRIALSDDLKLFTTTFVAGFLFVSILIG